MKNIFAILILVLVLTSCEKKPEPVLGCTDKEAENYNPNATDSDGNCTYAREAFLGDFSGTIQCGGLIPDPSPFTMSITEGLTGNNNVIIEIKDTPVAFPIVDGYAVTDSLYVTKNTYQIEVLGVPSDVEISGNAVYTDEQTTLSGLLKLQTELMGTPLTDNCTFTVKK